MDEAPGQRRQRVNQRGAILLTHDGNGIVVTTVKYQTPGAAQQALSERAQAAAMQLRPVAPPSYHPARRCGPLALAFDDDEETHRIPWGRSLPTRYALMWVDGDTLTAFYGPTLEHVLLANPADRPWV
jgi:hypothetical protein